MSIDINYFRIIQGTDVTDSEREEMILDAQETIYEGMLNSVGCIKDAKRNGITQPVVVNQSEGDTNKCSIVALPNDNLCIGDIVEHSNAFWIITEIKAATPIQIIGTAHLCNQLFRFQNSSPTVIEKWGVLDSGSYSIEEGKISTSDNKFKVYLPYDDDTKKLYLDKRFALHKMYNADGNEILAIYKITGIDPVSKSYGEGGHLLVLTIENSSDYSAKKDNLDLMVCDYIQPPTATSPSSGTLLPCSISGRSTIRLGSERTYTAKFYKADGVTEESGITPVWSVLPTDSAIKCESNYSFMNIGVEDVERLAGTTITISLRDSNNLYKPTTLEVEVTPSG